MFALLAGVRAGAAYSTHPMSEKPRLSLKPAAAVVWNHVEDSVFLFAGARTWRAGTWFREDNTATWIAWFPCVLPGEKAAGKLRGQSKVAE